MAKRRFYLILSIVTIISLFSFAAICTQCGAGTEDKVGTEDEEASEEVISQDEEEQEDEDNIEGEDGADETEAASEEDADSDADTSDDDADSEEAEDSDDAEAPTISLVVYEGPFPAGSLCVYRVQANVTGSPSPSITWSKDDSGGSWGTKKAQVNLNNPGDTYTLTATATNSAGSASTSIDLSWGCEEPEPEPEPEVHEIPIAANPDISGYLWDFGYVNLMSTYAFIGDSGLDYYSKGYFSFDISGLHGKTVQDAEINFTSITGYGEPSLLASEIVVKVYNYITLDGLDFAVGGVQLPSIPISAAFYTISGNTLKNELQDVLDNEVRDYFQLKLGLNATTNNDGIQDGIIINWSDAILNISYTD